MTKSSGSRISAKQAKQAKPAKPAKAAKAATSHSHGPITRLKTQGIRRMGQVQPGEVNFAFGGNGTTTHSNGELMKQATGLDMMHVPYKGSTPAVQDLIGVQTQILIDADSVLLPQVKGGKLKALAVAGPKRDPQVPDVPTATELALGGMEPVGFQGLVGPAGMPKDVVDRLAGEMMK